jgi:Cu(I)/Ag(I) efflux system membrane fusion protein
MDYIPVYEGEETDGGKTVKVSLDKTQRSGVRTEAAEPRVIVRPVRAVGTIRVDERRLTSVTLRSDGYIEELFVNTTGQHVEAGEPLFRVYSPQIQQVQIDLMVAVRALQRGGPGLEGDRSLEGPMLRLRNLGVPESRIREVRATGANPRTIDWPAPASGTVIEKRVINGQRVVAGEELYRIADLSQVWVIADVAESDLAEIKLGSRAAVTFRAYPTQPVQGEVTFIYPDLKPETRTVRVRIELPNPDGRLKPDMYADVVFHSGIDGAPVVAVPVSAVIDSGVRQVVLVAKGEGRFEPRAVKLGRRGNGHVEVVAGVESGEEVVTSATFLIDAESNLKAALQAFTQPEAPK